MEELGWQQWSFVFPKEGVENPRWMKMGHSKFLHPEDVDYLPYSRIEPASMVLAIASDVGERLHHPTAAQKELTGLNSDLSLAASALDAIYVYMKDQTFLTGFSHIADIVSSDSIEEAQRRLSKLGGTVISASVPYSSLLASIERAMDSEIDLLIPDRNIPPGIRTLYMGIRRAMDRTPFVETDGPIQRNRFYQPMLQKNATVLRVLLPPLVADILGDDIDVIKADPVKASVLAAGIPLTMPSKFIHGVPLTAEEYDRFLFFSMYPSNPKIPSLYQALAKQMNMKYYQEASQGDQQLFIRGVDSDYKSYAKDTLLYDLRDEYANEFFDLRLRVAENLKLIDDHGKENQ